MSARRPLIAGNWKMNGSSAFVDEFAHGLAEFELPDNVTVVLFPPIAYLGLAASILRDGPIQLGGQNAHTEVSGAFTGEVAPEMVRDLGGEWLLVGHSERRQHFAESDEIVADKFAAALRAGLKPILCVGETLDQRQAGDAESAVRRQVRAVADRVGTQAFVEGTLAYEPIWAIGTGQTASPDQAQAMHAVIRAEVATLSDRQAPIRILYGGSMNAENTEMLLAEPDVDGGLIGGAALQIDSFASIVAAAGAFALGDSTL
jgi:triosephosphate isomerase